MEKVIDRLEQYRILCDELSKENKKVFIKNLSGDFYFAYILFVGEKYLHVKCFEPKQRKGLKFQLRWATLVKIEEFEERVKND